MNIDWEKVRDIAQAALNGKVIQERHMGGAWYDVDDDNAWMFEDDKYDYRIKPTEPREFTLEPAEDHHKVRAGAMIAFPINSNKYDYRHNEYVDGAIKVREVLDDE